MGKFGSYTTALLWGLNKFMFVSRKDHACHTATLHHFAAATPADGDDTVCKMFTLPDFSFKAKKSIN